MDGDRRLLVVETALPALLVSIVYGALVHVRPELQAPIVDLHHPPVEAESQIAHDQRVAPHRHGRHQGDPWVRLAQRSPEWIESPAGAVALRPPVECWNAHPWPPRRQGGPHEEECGAYGNESLRQQGRVTPRIRAS